MPGPNSSDQNATARLAPVGSNERLLALDFLRGFALFGVLIAYTLWSLGSPPESTYSNIDLFLEKVMAALVDTKAYTLFAFLFGLGFSIQLTRAVARGVSIGPVYRRRLIALLSIGLMHAFLLRNGDILVPYAVTGFLLLLFRDASDKTLAVGAIIGLLFPYFARGVWELTGMPFPQRPDTTGMNIIASNHLWVRYWYATAITSWPGSLPMFLFGLYMGRRRFFENLGTNQKAVRRALIMGLALGTLAYAGHELLLRRWADAPLSFGQQLASGVLWRAHAWGLASFYASSLLLLSLKPAWQRRIAPLAAVGRMALTNYLMQAAVIVPVCIAFRLFDNVTPSIGLLLAVTLWAFQVPASVWWLNRFRFGPAEWVWRSLTYGCLQPMRVDSTKNSEPLRVMTS